MNTFKKKSLHAAVLAGLGALGAAGTANAVHINPDGLGQVVIYPYYTVRGGNVTAMSIVNTTSLTKAVKVRFLEGKNSREVLDFNLFLSPQDVWTGVVLTGTTPGGADGARLETGDNSCVTPSDLFGGAAGVATVRTDGLGLPINAFKNYQYTGVAVDNATMNTLDRTREGYMEVLEMGIVTNTIITGYIKHATSGTTIGVPANCAALDAYDADLGTPVPTTVGAVGKFPLHLASPAGGLTGRASIINSANGTNYTYDVTVFDGWWNPLVPAPGNVPYSASGNTNPSISITTGIDTVSNVFVTGNPAIPNSAGVVRAQWNTSREAVSAILMRDSVINEFVTDAGSVSKTDWVITMPTKRDNIGVGVGTPNRPFSNNFANATPTGACDAYSLAIFNREEGTIGTTPGVILPSPRPPGVIVPGQVLCWEANVIEFGSSGLLSSNNNFRLQGAADAFAVSGATTTGAPFATFSRRVLQGPNGWASFGFGATGTASQSQQSMTPVTSSLNGVADVLPRVHFGLPVIGAMFHNYTNTGVASSYGGVIPHKFTRNIQ
ncbi:MAG: hypothetical protein LH481_15035 [Burkholderiales bacterium]|nr:hypothetical protein [Burkholderiales bacterium]